MGRDRSAHQPLVGWLLGVLLAFCAVLPVASGPVGPQTASPGPATLVRSGNPQHLEAVAAPQRPDVSPSQLHQSAAIPPEQPDSLAVSGSTPAAVRTTTAFSASLTPSGARAPPSVPA